jgi:preprotein translocase subunit SecA
MFKKIVSSIVGDANKKIINNLKPSVTAINALEPQLTPLSDDALRERSLAQGARGRRRGTRRRCCPRPSPWPARPLRRSIGLRPYDVQLMGGMLLHRAKWSRCAPARARRSSPRCRSISTPSPGQGVHLVTVNEYLARRDGGWMGKIFHALGLSVGVIGPLGFSALFDPEYVNPGAELEDERLVHWRPCTRQQAYQADITYGISSEFGFDYLRDNMAIQ